MIRRIGLGAALAVLVLSGASCSDAKTPAANSVLPSRTVDAGSVDVTITPTRLDAQGATFAVVLDTHAVDLSMDLAASAVLEVDGRSWPDAAWTGDVPGGHHRSGELRFTPGGAAQGTARLTLAGFAKPVEASWNLPAS